MEKGKERKRCCQWSCFFIDMVKESLSIKVTFEQRPKGNERVSYKGFQGRVFQAEGTMGENILNREYVWCV